MHSICPIIIIAKYRELNSVELTSKYFKINRKKLSRILNDYNAITKIRLKFKQFLKENKNNLKCLDNNYAYSKYIKICKNCSKQDVIEYSAVNYIVNNNTELLCKSCVGKKASNNLGRFKKGHKSWTLGLYGKNHPSWQGGKTAITESIRSKSIYLKFKKSVLIRDNYTCVLCSCKENLEVDHIKEIRNFPHLAYDVSNGRTLCHDCHIKTDNYGAKARNIKCL